MFSKRRKLSGAPSVQGFLERLPRSLVEEVLLRLPLFSVFRSRCVCKLFLSLTTSPYFIRQRQLHRSPFRQDPPLVLLLQNCRKRREFFLCSGEREIKLSGFSLDFLPGSNYITVMASCEDLLLCCNSLTLQRDYFIVNPFTHQWLALPPTLHQHMYVLFGFVCDPSSIAEAKEGGELRYRVVRIAVPLAKYNKEFNVEIFSSEDGQWKEYIMTSVEATRTRWWSHRGVSCNGILYWQFYFGRGKVMRLDPFNPNRDICIIEGTPDMLPIENIVSLPFNLAPLDLIRPHDEPKIYMIGICGGKLKMSEMVWFHAHLDEILFLNIWEMEDGESEWRMVKVVPLKEIILANPLIVPPTTLRVNACRPLAFHPTDENIIYLESYVMSKSNVICCNSKMRSVEIVDGYDFNKRFSMNADAFPFLLPYWPTPIPALP